MSSLGFFVVLLCACLCVGGFSVDFQKAKRSAEETTPKESDDICMKSTPCGWAVYHRFTRNIDYFMKNKCECPENKKCIRTDDDISITAFVYRCKEPKKENDSKDTRNES